MDYNEILRTLRTNKDWQVTGNTYESIIWRDKTCEIPSEEECLKTWNEIKLEIPWRSIREKRNILLTQTDRYATLDYPHSNLAVQQTWFDYRQALRDLPTATEDPSNPVWPVPPQ
jgi:hypothetical protein